MQQNANHITLIHLNPKDYVKFMEKLRLYSLFFILSFSSNLFAIVLNNPYPTHARYKNIYYSSFSEQPKTLDPARAYTSNEFQFIGQIYEPLLEYDYYKRPYNLIPLTAKSMPSIRYLDKDGKTTTQKDEIKYTVYTIALQEQLFFQPHPAFAQNKEGAYLYLNLDDDFIKKNNIHRLTDFKELGSRLVTADDYLYQIKRLATPSIGSPIYGLMSEHILGFKEFKDQLPKEVLAGTFLDLRNYDMAGLKKLDDWHFEITLKSQYAQFIYWLAMPFFSPIPWEVDKFYSQWGMKEQNLTFDWYPVGTGAFMLTENNPNRRMVLAKNPHFRVSYFPDSLDAEDKAKGYTQNAGKRLPLIDKAVYRLEKESIPRWNKFLQGYYDLSAITNESFDQAIQISPQGNPILTEELKAKAMRLIQTYDPAIFYLGFNMQDPVVGGNSERARKLRLAISIVLDYEEQIAIFFNGRGSPAHSPIPPQVFGHKEGAAGINPYLYQWDAKQGRAHRLPLAKARTLLSEAGYPGGIDPKTGKPLILYYDVSISGSPDDKSMLDWMRKQFAKLGIDLNIRGTLYNRFQDKIRTGNAQMFSWGWSADYPDPENFLFMFYSQNGTAQYGGQNSVNYANKTFDTLFDALKNRPNDAIRQKLIDEALEILRHDAPWAFGIYTNTLILAQDWVYPVKPNSLGSNALKYVAIDIDKRNQLRDEWNQAVLWPIVLILVLIILFCIPILRGYYQKEQSTASRVK